MEPSILITAGESSGEKYGAALVSQFLQSHSDISFFGIGGLHMQKAGVDILFPVKDLAVVGFFEIISHLPRIHRILQKIEEEAKKRVPFAAVLIDSPDFNLRLAKKLSKLGIPVLYYISPTVWAWRKRRIKTIQKYVSKMLLIFPFEEEIYRAKNIPFTFVGHPLLERVKTQKSREDFLKKYKLDPEQKIIAVLPGSRHSEFQFHSHILQEAMTKIREKWNVYFFVLQADNISTDDFDGYFSRVSGCRVISEDFYDALAYSDIAWSSCGTANLESALLETPVIAFYKLSPLTYFFGNRLVKIKNYSIVNILAGKKVIPELIQSHFTADSLCHETEELFRSNGKRNAMIHNFQEIKKQLGARKASENAASELWDLIDKR